MGTWTKARTGSPGAPTGPKRKMTTMAKTLSKETVKKRMTMTILTRKMNQAVKNQKLKRIKMLSQFHGIFSFFNYYYYIEMPWNYSFSFTLKFEILDHR